MLTFLQFVLEKFVDQTDHHYETHVHSLDVGTTGLDISYSRYKTRDPEGHYHVNFRVNGSSDKANSNNKDPAVAQRLLQHVGKSVHQFVKHKNPSRLMFTGNTSEKQHLYGAFARSMAKHLNGKAMASHAMGLTTHHVQLKDDA